MLTSNSLSGSTVDNPAIIFGFVIIIAGLYVQAYLNRPLLAANTMTFAFWLIQVLVISHDGVTSTAVFWILAVSPGATLIAGARSGLIWYLICLITIWLTAALQYYGLLATLSETSALHMIQLGPGRVFYIAIEVTSIMTILVVVTFVFWSARRRIEDNLRDAVRALESEVHYRTQAEAEARQSVNAKSTFLVTRNMSL